MTKEEDELYEAWQLGISVEELRDIKKKQKKEAKKAKEARKKAQK